LNANHIYLTDRWFDDYAETDFARSGTVATETVVLDAGPLEDFAHSMEPHLRKLGMPSALNKGVITLLKDYEVCREGVPLTSEQASILVSHTCPPVVVIHYNVMSVRLSETVGQ
jgi:hypothetical protein